MNENETQTQSSSFAPPTQPRTWRDIGFYLSLASFVVLTGCSFFGINGGDIARSDVPTQIQKTRGLPARVSHNRSVRERNAWVAENNLIDSQWRAAQDVSGDQAARYDAFGLALEQEATNAATTLLGGSAFSGIAAAFFGLLRSQKREEVAYNQGRTEAKEDMSEGASALKSSTA